MSVIEDPLLALIIRFVMKDERHQRADDEFVQRQLDTLKAYVDRYPAEERQPRAMQWIERHAANYRREWQKKVLPRQAADNRCHDCPLDSGNHKQHCTIHGEWLGLLQAYLRDEIDSSDYVRNALELLREHKNELRIQRRGLTRESS